MLQLAVDASRPIYRQVIEGVVGAVVRGHLSPGDQIPSQRELAENLRVNPNTVQRAYREMEAMGVVETRRGQGTFISHDEELISSLRRRMAEEAVRRFVGEMLTLGMLPEGIVQMVRAGFENQGPRSVSDEAKEGKDE